MNNQNTIHEISPEALQVLGGGKLAYVKTIRSEDVQKHFPQAPELAPGSVLYALHAADGTPIMLTDSREAAIANLQHAYDGVLAPAAARRIIRGVFRTQTCEEAETFFYPDLGPLGRAPKGGEYGHVDAHLNRVIPPVPGGHHPSVQIEDALDF